MAEFRGGLTSGMQVAHSRTVSSLEGIRPMGRLSSPPVPARVVVVDDDDQVREVTEMVLAGAGHSVRATANGFEALHWLEEQPWDLLILDLRMPEIDGPTLYREVLARWPAAASHILFVSGVTEMPHHDDTVNALNVPVLLKPFTLDALRTAVERVLATI